MQQDSAIVYIYSEKDADWPQKATHYGCMVYFVDKYALNYMFSAKSITAQKGFVLAFLQALRLKNNVKRIMCDLEYIWKGYNQWMHQWKKNGWKRKEAELAHVEQWKAIYNLHYKNIIVERPSQGDEVLPIFKTCIKELLKQRRTKWEDLCVMFLYFTNHWRTRKTHIMKPEHDKESQSQYKEDSADMLRKALKTNYLFMPIYNNNQKFIFLDSTSNKKLEIDLQDCAMKLWEQRNRSIQYLIELDNFQKQAEILGKYLAEFWLQYHLNTLSKQELLEAFASRDLLQALGLGQSNILPTKQQNLSFSCLDCNQESNNSQKVSFNLPQNEPQTMLQKEERSSHHQVGNQKKSRNSSVSSKIEYEQQSDMSFISLDPKFSSNNSNEPINLKPEVSYLDLSYSLPNKQTLSNIQQKDEIKQKKDDISSSIEQINFDQFIQETQPSNKLSQKRRKNKNHAQMVEQCFNEIKQFGLDNYSEFIMKFIKEQEGKQDYDKLLYAYKDKFNNIRQINQCWLIISRVGYQLENLFEYIDEEEKRKTNPTTGRTKLFGQDNRGNLFKQKEK